MTGFEALLAASKVLFTKTAYDFFFKWGIDTSLIDMLETLVNTVKSILSDAERSRIHDDSFVDMLVDKARLAVYDAEDLLDLIFTDIHKEKYKLGDSPRDIDIIKGKLKNKGKDIIRTIHPFRIPREAAIRNLIQRLESIVAQMSNLGLDKHDELTKFRESRMSTSSDNDPFKVVGRSKIVKEILDVVKSRDGNKDDLHVIPIIGMGGVGKTTVASMVYDRCLTSDQSLSRSDQSSCESDLGFQVKGWVCVSDKFEVTHVIKSLLESLTGQDSKATENLEFLLKELKRELRGKRFLLVLDDVWSNIEDKWEIFQNIFSVGARGSKIIVTTREENLARALSNCDGSYILNGLSYGESWLLFQRHAFINGDSSAYPSLETIGKKIVAKCKGLPLPVKMLGRLLRSKGNDENEWHIVLHSKIWKSANNILPSLWLSYHHLSLPVKQCFAYFSVFPKGYLFSRDEMVMLWIAEGLVEKHHESSSCGDYEHMAQSYFKHLHSNFFIQPSSSGKSGFVMHDLLHDLAEYVSKENVESRRFANIEDRNKDVFSTRLIQEMRTFLLDGCVYDSAGPCNNQNYNELLSNFKVLRVLSLKGCPISKFPHSITKMMLLRYLDLSGTNIDYLPNLISRLFNLQVLQLSNCTRLRSLPTTLCNLVNLRHLIMKNIKCEEMPDGIGRLYNLRTLSHYVIGKGKSKQIRELKQLSNLRGKLCVSGLNNIDDTDDIVTAGFGNKDLEELVLKWTPSRLRDTVLDEAVLDAMQPHKNLKRLTIKWYGGKMLANWIVGDTPNLMSLNIINCFNCEVLPAVGNLSCLTHLCIKGLDSLKSLGEEFYGGTYNAFEALEIFAIFDMEVLKTWSFPRGLSSLKKLHLHNCPKLTDLPCCLPSTLELDIQECPVLRKINVCTSTTCGHWLLR